MTEVRRLETTSQGINQNEIRMYIPGATGRIQSVVGINYPVAVPFQHLLHQTWGVKAFIKLL